MDLSISTTSATSNTESRSSAKSIVRYAPAVARVLLGLQFCFSGGYGLLPNAPEPAPGSMPENALAFLGALSQVGYLWPLISGLELLAGVLLLSNRFVPLALALLAPLLVNIVAFHVFLDPASVPVILVLLAFELYLAWTYRNAFRGMLAAKPAI